MRFSLRNRLGLAPFLLALTAAGGCSGAPSRHATPIAKADPDELVVVTTSDFHAALSQAEGLASRIRELKSSYGDQMLFLDAGDLFQGALEGNLSKGKSIVELFNLLGLDAAAIGNHELDYGPDVPGRTAVKMGEDGMGNLKVRVRQARFKWLSANVVRKPVRKCHPHPGAGIEHCNALGQRTVFEPHAIFTRAGRKVCVIGATTPETPDITRPEFIKGVAFEALKPVIEAEARYLRNTETCELVLLTAHAGLLCDKQGHCKEEGDRAEMLRLLRELPVGTVDAVVAGHTHLLAQELIGGVPVIETGTGATHVGVMHISGTSGNLRARFENFIPVPAKAEQPDVTALLKPYRDTANELRERAVGTAAGFFHKEYNSETALGNLIADALLEMGKETEGADFALVNAGGIRSDLPSGPINYGDVFKVLPFDNSLTVVTLTGAELRRVLEIAFSGGHGITPVSGLHIRRINAPPGARGNWDRDLNGDGRTEDWERNLLVEVTDNAGHPLDDAKTYRLATLDFLVAGGDHQAVAYAPIPPARKHVFGDIWARDIVADYLKKHPDVRPEDYYDASRPRIVNTAPSK